MSFYYILHVLSGFLLTALTFAAFAAPTPESRKRNLRLTGILALVMLIGGFGLMARLQYQWAPWVFIKIGCWLILSGMAGMAYRRPGKGGFLMVLTGTLVAIAVSTVYLADKPLKEIEPESESVLTPAPDPSGAPR